MVYHLVKGFSHRLRVGSPALLQPRTPVFLFVGHPAFASEGAVVGEIEILGLFSRQQGNVVWKILTHTVTFKAIGDELFLMTGDSAQCGVCGKCVMCKTADAIDHRCGRDREIPRDVADTAGRSQLCVDEVIIDCSFDVVVDTERLGAEPVRAIEAQEPLHLAGDL